MSDMKASVVETPAGFSVAGYEKIEYDFTFLDNVFDPSNRQLADCYTRWGRCLAVMDYNIFNLYGAQVEEYFGHHNLELKIHKTMIGEKAKSIETFLSIVDSMTEFGIFRKVRAFENSRQARELETRLTRLASCRSPFWSLAEAS
ncbi:MAG: hypothetical protein INR71_16100 [Terriglobus roseus]|nr:hypothetical protein [Terriglobus roseus]